MSPDQLNVRPKYVKTVRGFDKEKIKAPMAVVPTGSTLYVADSGNGRLSIMSQTGTVKNTIKPQQNPGSATYPVGITIDEEERLYISVIGANGSVLVFNNKGDFLYRFPDGASADAAVSAVPVKPIALFASQNRLYVTDVVDQDVKVYDYYGKLVSRFGRPGSEKGEFLYPNGIVADKNGDIFVADSNNARVQVFNEKGEFLRLFTGSKKEPLALPRGIAIDAIGRVHVVDTFKHKVFVFTKEGRLLFTYGGFGSGATSLAYPNGISINNQTGEIFIADKQNNRISIWK